MAALFPQTITVLIRADGTFAYYPDEKNLSAPIDNFTDVATYQLTKTEQIRRKIVFERRPTPPVQP